MLAPDIRQPGWTYPTELSEVAPIDPGTNGAFAGSPWAISVAEELEEEADGDDPATMQVAAALPRPENRIARSTARVSPAQRSSFAQFATGPPRI